MTNTHFRAGLECHDACQPALDWLGDRDAATAWAECPRADWLLWWTAEAGMAVPRALLADIVRAALDWACPVSQLSPTWPEVESAVESVIDAMEGRGDLDTAWAAAEATRATRAASAAAEAAASAAAWAASAAAEAARATRAASAAARAASAAALAARAARAASAAALAAAWAAEAAASTELADLVRRHMPMPAMEGA